MKRIHQFLAMLVLLGCGKQVVAGTYDSLYNETFPPSLFFQESDEDFQAAIAPTSAGYITAPGSSASVYRINAVYLYPTNLNDSSCTASASSAGVVTVNFNYSAGQKMYINPAALYTLANREDIEHVLLYYITTTSSNVFVFSDPTYATAGSPAYGCCFRVIYNAGAGGYINSQPTPDSCVASIP